MTAWGIFDSRGTSTHSTQRFNTVTADGTPRRITIDRTRHAVKIGKVQRYQQDGFTPRLFSDGYGFFGYTIGGGTLKRYPLTIFPNGDERYIHPEKVGSGLGDLTSLQSASYVKARGVVSEILYATTSAGDLLQIVAPVDRPGRARVHKLAKTGYEGVTELSWSQCNERGDRQSLIAINPTTNQATWTTIKRSFTHPKAKLRGAVTGGADWNLSAVL